MATHSKTDSMTWYKDIWRVISKPPLLEIVLGIIGAIAAAIPPFDSPTTSLLIGFLSASIGIGRLALTTSLNEINDVNTINLRQNLSKIDRLIDVVDLNNKIDEPEPLEVFNLYTKITNDTFEEAKSEIVKKAIAELSVIVHQKRTPDLSTTEYYSYLNKLLNESKNSDEIVAISTGLAPEWTNDTQENIFFEANQNVIKRGGSITRYFVYEKNAFDEVKINNLKIAAHFSNTKLKGLFSDRKSLSTSDKPLLDSIGAGFILFNSTIAVVDIAGDKDSPPRGYVTVNKSDLNRFTRIINQLKQISS